MHSGSDPEMKDHINNMTRMKTEVTTFQHNDKTCGLEKDCKGKSEWILAKL